MKKIFYNSAEWGIQENGLDKIRYNGFEFLNKIGCNTSEFYSLTIQDALKKPESVDRIFSKGIPFVVLLEPNSKKYPKMGKYNVKNRKTLYGMIKEIKPEMWKNYSISIVEQIQDNGKQFVGTAISDGKGKLFMEFLLGTTNSKYLTSTGADPTKLDWCAFSDYETMTHFPKKVPLDIVEKIKQSCQFFEGYYEFVYGKSRNINDIFFTFYSNINDYKNILKNIEERTYTRRSTK